MYGEFAWVRKQARIFEILNIYLTALCDTIGQLLTFLCIRVYGIHLYVMNMVLLSLRHVRWYLYTLLFPFIDRLNANIFHRICDNTVTLDIWIQNLNLTTLS